MSDFLYSGSASAFATARRGGLSGEEIREIEAHRAKDRPTPWRVLADRYGRCESDIRALFAPRPAETGSVVDPMPRVSAPLTWVGVREEERQSPNAAFWDEKAERRLRVMFIDLDMTAAETARSLGCSERSVVGKARRMGLRKKALPQAEAA